jgi:hypothetical protein
MENNVENKKVIVNEIEKLIEETMSILWSLEKKYGEIHRVMKTIKDGNIVVKNAEGALLKIAMDKYYENHEEFEFNEKINKAIHTISEAKMKTMDLNEIILIEKVRDEINKEAEISVLKSKILALENRLDKSIKSKEMEKKEIETTEKIDVEIPEDQEKNILMKPKPEIKPEYKDWTSEDWDKFRGNVVEKRKTLDIRENVLNEIKENMEKGTRYVLDIVIGKYYPLASRISQSVYLREYYKSKSLNKKISIPSYWIREKPISKQDVEKPKETEKKNYEKQKESIERIETYTYEDWVKLRGEKIAEYGGVDILKNVAKEIENHLDDGPLYILENIMPKYYPFAKKVSHQVYVRSYFRHFGYRIYSGGDWKNCMVVKLDEIKQKQKQKQIKDTLKKATKKAIRGERPIKNKIALRINKTYKTTTTMERYESVLKAIYMKKGLTQEECKSMMPYTISSIYAHLRYGIEIGDIKVKNSKYYLRANGKNKAEILFKDIEKTSKKETEQKTEETAVMKKQKVQLDGTPIDDEIAREIHRKYSSPPRVERYEKIKNILESAILFKKTIPQLSEQTGWSKYSVQVQILYGTNEKIGEITACGMDENKDTQYCLTKNKDKIIKPKETKVKSKSWLKWQ